MKTLDEMGTSPKFYPEDMRVVAVNDLKIEARKWIKELRKGTHPKFTYFTKRSCDDCANLLEHFFGVSEND